MADDKEPTLNDRNKQPLRYFVMLHLVFFMVLALSRKISLTSVEHFWERLSLKDGFVAAGFPLFVLLLNGVLGELAKERIVFWRWRDPLPGCRAFSKTMREDPRVDEARLTAKMGRLPTDPHEQNSTWYRMYKAHASKPVILEAHVHYLLTRDITAISAVLGAALSVGIFFSPLGRRGSALYAGALLVQYVVAALNARNNGERFVADVLTEESHA